MTSEPVITEDMRAIVESAGLGFVATTCPDGSPNLSPKGSIRVYDDRHLVFANIASPGTIANLHHDPRVEINSVDFLRRRGYRFKGRAEIIEPGDHPAYRWIADWLCQTHGPKVPAHQAVLVSVEQALHVDSPAYTVLGAQEDDLLRAWARRYGEGLEQHLSQRRKS
jgi:predicted pyridoxine 5'-phosphate oxidase superfamily flavin-nucleotide-binding protein